MRKEDYIEIISKIRWQWVYGITGLLYLIFLCWTPIMPTLDGAMHHHNSVLLEESLTGELSASTIVSNPAGWVNAADHLLLIVLSFFLPPTLTQKFLLGIVFLTAAFGWWRLIRITEMHGAWSLAFYSLWVGWGWFMGFFNFMMASSLMIWLIPLILEKKPSLSQRWWLMAGSTLLAGLHLYVFATAGMLMVCRLLASIRSTENPFRASINSLIPFLPGSVFLLVMLGLSDAGGRELALSAIGTKLWLFFSGSVFKGLDPGKEDRFVFWILLAVLVHLAYWIRSKSRTSEKWKSNPFLWVTTGSLILLLVIPDHVGAGSFLPYRVVFFLFLFLFLWLASHKVSVVHSFLVMIFLSIGNMGFLGYYAQFLPSHGKMAKELIACGEDMQEGSVVLSLSADAHWMQEHFSAYLGLTKELILLDNYELSSGAFPLKLDEANLYMVGQQPAHSISCHTITFPPSGEEKQVGYVLLLASRKESDVCKNAIKDLMSNGYSLLEEKPGFMLYQKKAALSDGLEGVQDK